MGDEFVDYDLVFCSANGRPIENGVISRGLRNLIKENDLFVNIQEAKGRTKEAAVLETHVKMIDIQVPIDGEETFGYTPLCDLPAFEYNAEKDITKYGDTPSQTYVTVKPGQMIIFFPQDGHAPCITDKSVIKKAIFKVKA